MFINIVMKTIIVKSLVNSENSHSYPGELLFEDHTTNFHPYNIIKLHHSNCIKAIDILGFEQIVLSNIIVCCSTIEAFRRPVATVEEITEDVIYTDRGFLIPGINNLMSDFKHFYGDLLTVTRFCSNWKSLYNDNICESAIIYPSTELDTDSFTKYDYISTDTYIKTMASHLNIRYNVNEINILDM